MTRWMRHLVVLGLALPWLGSCGGPETVSVGPALSGEPNIRVRLTAAAEQATFNRPGQLTLRTLGDESSITVPAPITVTYRDTRWRVNGELEPTLSGWIEITASDESMIGYGDLRYPQSLLLIPRRDRPPGPDGGGRFDVVNHLHLEAYLPGVLARELYDGWRPTTYYAQAIAARSYAIHRILNAPSHRHFDVESTQASQAYIGHTANTKAVAAVLETTGLALTWNNRVIPAFYSSTCGGVGASPTDAFGGPTEAAPLLPRGHEPWCRESKHYSWGPIERDEAILSRRLAAWGRSRDRPLKDLGRLRTLVIVERNGLGRPTRFAVTDHLNKTYALSADAFRVACNYPRPEALASSQRLKSAFVDIELRRGKVIFRGRGYGHGVGMCQFGAEAMADSGHDVSQILQTYYPDAMIQRVY